MGCVKSQLLCLSLCGAIFSVRTNLVPRSAFHSTQNSGNFGWYIKWNGPFRFGPTGIFRTSFEGGPLSPVGPKFPFPFDKFVVPSTALLCPAFKDKTAECSDSMYKCSICGNRSTDLQVPLMHSCSSITGGLLYNDLITVSVPFKILYPA